MIFNNFFKAEYKRKIVYIVFAAYILILLVLYAFFITSAASSSTAYVRNDMRKRLDSLLTSIEADFKSKVVDAKYLARDNTLKQTLILSLSPQLTEFTDNFRRSAVGLDKLLITDEKNRIFYNSTKSIIDLSGIEISDQPYSCYAYLNRVFLLYYMPVVYENRRVGSVIAAYDFSDFSDTAAKVLEGGPYEFYGFANGEISFILDKKGSYSVGKPIDRKTYDSLREGFSYLTVNGDRNMLLVKPIELRSSKRPLMLSIVLPESAYKNIEMGYLRSGLLNCALISLIITFILIIAYWAFNYYVSKELSKRMELLNLRTQKHDFSKHLNIIKIMAKTGEYRELTEYVESLGKKVLFENKLLKIDNPPVNALLQEKELEAHENEIRFDVEVGASLRDIRTDAADLCTILANLLDNAIEASMETPPEQRYIRVEIEYADGWHCLKVANAGKPVPEKYVRKIFTPGYSTKKDKKGRGMGLYIVSRLLKKYRGSVEVDCKDGVTSFKVAFPGKRGV